MPTAKAQSQVKTQAPQAQIQIQIQIRNGRKTKLSLGELALRSYGLGDGEELHRSAPDTFWIPSAEERATLQPGQTVKLAFHQRWLSPSCAERMWVTIVRRDAGGYVGRLANEPESITALQLGDVVRFTMKNVIKIFSADDVAIAIRDGAHSRLVRTDTHGQST